VDAETERWWRQEAARAGQSFDDAVSQKLQSEAQQHQEQPEETERLIDKFPRWSHEQAEEFLRTVHELGFEDIDEEMWK
jgi:hypothetical protein